MYDITCKDINGNTIEYLGQWDSNVIIRIPNLGLTEAPIVHFSNCMSDNALSVKSTLVGSDIQVAIPNILLQGCKPIWVYIYTYNSDTNSGRTIHEAKIPVHPKKKPTDYIFEENIVGVNIVELDAQVKLLKSIIETVKTTIPNAGVAIKDASGNLTAIKLQHTYNGKTTDLFTVNIK